MDLELLKEGRRVEEAMISRRERQGVALRATLPPGSGAEESELQVTGELRTRIGADQWKDEDLRPWLQRLSSERGTFPTREAAVR